MKMKPKDRQEWIIDYIFNGGSRANANRVRRRLEDPDVWGGVWRLEKVA